MEKMMTLDEVSHYLRISQRTIFRYIKSGKLRAYRIGQWRVTETDLKAFLKKVSNV
ncbi:MAG: helix-turn-helix domain-containing protein [Patescibacteria group bacterium]|jgi:excisionase family DNA binding protein